MTASTGAVLDRPRVLGWSALTLIVLAAWIAILSLRGRVGAEADWLTALCTAVPGDTGFATLAAMWVLMGAAMMLPTAAPAIDLYGRLVRKEPETQARQMAGFVAGYLVVWSAFGLAAAGLNWAAADTLATMPPDALVGGLLVVAGLYQLTPVKQACLAACRNPLGHFMRHWREGPAGALRLGISHGAVCVGCCWALMALMLAAGAMNPAWMVALGALMLAEKTVPGADRAGRLLGLAAALAGAALILNSIIL